MGQKWLVLVLFVFLKHFAFAQNGVDKSIRITVDGKTLTEVLYEISSQHNITFYFVPDDLPYYSLEGSYERHPVFQIIQVLLNGTNLKLLPYKDHGLFIVRKDQVTSSNLENILAAWEEGKYSYPLESKIVKRKMIFGSAFAPESESVFLELSILDRKNRMPLIGATISDATLSIAEATDVDGKIMLSLPPGEYMFDVTYTGYQDLELDLKIYESAKAELKLVVKSYFLDEINIVANSTENMLSNTESGKEVINLEKLEYIPQLMGELDIVKSLELLPGVTTSTELSQGFNVRGGSTDQNLILLNDGIIFNPTHIVGFISALNADVITDATLYKGYVDPSFGSRLSGVLDMHAHAKRLEKFEFKGGLGTSLLKFQAKGPLTSKIDFMAGARGSFNDHMLRRIANASLQKSNARFYDLNFALNYRIGEQTKIQVYGYKSDDYFEFNDEFGFNWGNANVGAKVDSYLGKGIYSSFSLSRGNYISDNFTLESVDAFIFSNGINYNRALLLFNKQMNELALLKLGVEFLQYRNDEDALRPNDGSITVPTTIQRKGSQSISPFLSFNMDFSDLFFVDLGVRLSQYTSLGPGNVYSYEGTIDEHFIVDKVEISGLDSESVTSILEPRLSVSLKPSDFLTIKAAYNKSSQNIFQASTTNSALPSDIYIMADRYIKPSTANQFAFGMALSVLDNSYGISLDGFYKSYGDLYELKDFSDLILNDHLETELLTTEGKSSGFEMLLDKNKGKWKGSLAYTYSKTQRRTVDERESINGGAWFDASFDIPHQVNLLASYQWLPSVSFNLAYVYRSGRPTTAPTSTIEQDGVLLPLYSDRNKERIAHYSRVDFSLILDLRKSKKSGFRNAFSMGFYNLLARNNPSNVFFRRSAKGNVVPFQFSVVGSVVPNISWNFTF